MELSSGQLTRDEYLRAVRQIVDFLRKAGVDQLAVAYGFGCDCPEEQEFEDIEMPLERLLGFIEESEAVDYRLGQDNLHVKDPRGRVELLFCHESDIHFISDEAELMERLRVAWAAEGFCKVLVHPGTEKQGVGGQAGEAEAGCT